MSCNSKNCPFTLHLKNLIYITIDLRFLSKFKRQFFELQLAQLKNKNLQVKISLIKSNIVYDRVNKLLSEINSQLSKNNLKVKKANLAVTDATLIESNARPNRTKIIEENITQDREEEENCDDNKITNLTIEESESSDPDATWLKKGKKYYFGFKSFITTDEEGFIEKTKTIPANQSEINQMEDMVIDSNEFAGDKGYDSKSNRQILRNKGIKTRIMYKKPKGKPMTKWQKRFNKAISKRRFIVEQTFGTIKRRFKFNKASYFTTKKVNAQFTLKAICLNLLKAVNKIKALIPPKQLKLG